MSIQIRNQTCQKLNFCKICTRNKTSKIHQTPTGVCLYVDRFSCTHCTGDKAVSHCNLLCYAQEDSDQGLLMMSTAPAVEVGDEVLAVVLGVMAAMGVEEVVLDRETLLRVRVIPITYLTSVTMA